MSYDADMKISVTLSDDEVRFLDEHARLHTYPSRAAVLRKAVRVLRSSTLGDAYADAWAQWEAPGEADVWASAANDGYA